MLDSAQLIDAQQWLLKQAESRNHTWLLSCVSSERGAVSCWRSSLTCWMAGQKRPRHEEDLVIAKVAGMKLCTMYSLASPPKLKYFIGSDF